MNYNFANIRYLYSGRQTLEQLCPLFDIAENAVIPGQVLLQEILVAPALCLLLICVYYEHLHHLVKL